MEKQGSGAKITIFFLFQDDIGISGVIGSAIFNITLVIAVCALAAEQVFYLNWWSVLRDCACYLVSIAVLLMAIADESISWSVVPSFPNRCLCHRYYNAIFCRFESLIFLILYVVYCVGMGFSSKIEAVIADRLPVPQSWRDVQKQGGIDADKMDADREANYKNMEKNSNGGEGGGFVTVECKPPPRDLYIRSTN